MAPIGAFAWLLFASVAPEAQSVQPLRADGIELEIRRRGAAKTVKVPLEYRHGVSPAEPRRKE
jgi:hypothetical protein